MREITAPIIAITLVLLSVFVPLAFIPGLTGSLFRQCAVTISVAMLISAINALTLSPALCGIFLRPGGHKRGIMGKVLKGIDKTRDGYAAVVKRLVRVSVAAACSSSPVSRSAIYFAALRTPTGLPARGGPGRVLRLDPAARRRLRVADQRHREDHGGPAAEDAAGLRHVRGDRLFVPRRVPASPMPASWWSSSSPSSDRTAAADSAQAMIGKVFGAAQQIRTGNVIAFNLPPIIGLSTSGGFEYDLEALEGQDPTVMGSVAQGLIAAANADPALAARVHHLHGLEPLALPRHRSREGERARGQHRRHLQRAAVARSAAITSTTSTSTAAPGRSTSRARPRTGARSPRSGRSTSRTSRARKCRCARSPRCAWCRGRR